MQDDAAIHQLKTATPMPQFDLTPVAVPKIATANRRIRTKIPVPASLPILEQMRRYEPQSMSGMPPVVWKRGRGALVEDWWGNRWIDWSSGVLITNAGHGATAIVDAIVKQAKTGLLTNYLFPHKLRPKLARMLVERAQRAAPNIDKCFLLSTGSETTECAIKLCRTRGRKMDPAKLVVVSFTRAFHGRTLGAQQIGGIPALKEWIGNLDPGFVNVEFPDGFRCKDTRFEFFEEQLARLGVDPARVCGVILETYQGGGASFAPTDYIRTRPCSCSTKCRPALAAPAPTGASSTTACSPTSSAAAKASPVPCRSPVCSATTKSWTCIPPAR